MDGNRFRAFADSLFTQFGTRMWRGEKLAFLERCRAELTDLGYGEVTVREDKNMLGLTSRNMLVGRPDAEILITAHYDTPGRNGWIMLGSSVWGSLFFIIALGFMVQIIERAFPAAADIFPALPVNIGVWDVIFIVLIVSSLIKNKHNYTDNTSGVLGVAYMASLIADDPELRKRCAFVLFDHEELGLVGSRAFARWRRRNYPGKADCQVINLDCIGNGDILAVMTWKEHKGWHEIADFMRAEGYDVNRTSGGIKALTVGTSDHAVFPGGVSLLFYKRSRLGPAYIPGIHTGRDKICDLEKIERLCASIYKYLKWG